MTKKVLKSVTSKNGTKIERFKSTAKNNLIEQKSGQ